MTVEETVAVEETTASAAKKIATEEVSPTGKKTENDEDDTGAKKLKGKVVLFFRGRGFGFIIPAKENQKEIMVRWENIVTDDPYPYIKPGTEIEYLIEKDKNGKPQAKEVTLKGGAKIPIFTKDLDDREPNTEDIYKGTIETYKRWKGFGFLKPDKEITWKEITTEGSLFFSKIGIVAPNGRKSGYRFKISRGKRVCFKIYKDKKGLGAYEMKKLDGTPIEQETIEEGQNRYLEEQRKRKLAESGASRAKRAKIASGTDGGEGDAAAKSDGNTEADNPNGRQIDKSETVFVGRVKLWKKKQKFGFLIPKEKIEFMGMNAKRGVFVSKDDIICTSEEVGLKKGSNVKFQIYKDSKGLGAYDVRGMDDMPLVYQPVMKVESANTEPKIIAGAEEQKPEPEVENPEQEEENLEQA